jgi:hypothetical protein
VNDPNYTVSSSSQWADPNLNQNFRALDNASAWCCNSANAGEKYYVKSTKLESWVGITTQGRPNGGDQWVKKFKVMYTRDNNNWFDYNGGQVFDANTDINTKVSHEFVPPIIATQIAITTVEVNNWTSLRFEVFVDQNYVPRNEYNTVPSSRILGKWKNRDNNTLEVSRTWVREDTNTGDNVGATQSIIESWITPTIFIASYTHVYVHFIDESTQTLTRVQLDARDPRNPKVFHEYPITGLNKDVYTLA